MLHLYESKVISQLCSYVDFVAKNKNGDGLRTTLLLEELPAGYMNKRWDDEFTFS